MAGAGAPPCTTSIMWSVFEMWKLQECNSEYDYNLYVDIVGRNNHAKVIKLSQAHFQRLWSVLETGSCRKYSRINGAKLSLSIAVKELLMI